VRILLVTPQLPYPPRQGTTIRNFNLIRGLAQRHTIDLLTFLAPDELLADDSPLHQLCGRVATAEQPQRTTAQRAIATLSTFTPDMGLRLESPAMHALIQEWTRTSDYDIVQIEGIELAQYGRAAVMQAIAALRTADMPRARKRPALVFDNHNCEYLLQQRNAMTDLRHPRRWPAAVYSLVQWQKLRRYEAASVRDADAVVAVSDADRAALLELNVATPISVISNGIDLDAYRPLDRPPPTSRTLVFTGKMDYRPNIDAAIWFAQEVLPRVLDTAPDARFQIVGMNPHPRLDILRGHPAIEITGAVADTRPYIHNAAAYIIPMRIGGGTRFKALEAMACGAPIVSTTLGVEGIPLHQGEEMLLADSPSAFAAAVLQLLSSSTDAQALRQRLGAQGRRFVEAHYGWEQIIPKLESVLEAARQRASATT
jgi:glycosyltransferase involved in cell wall biosynthesis